MNRISFYLSVLLAPVLVLGTTSCSSMSQTKARLAEWNEKREERRMAQEVAQAEKEIAEQAAAGGPAESSGMEESIFLNYANPGGVVAGGGVMNSPALPGSELPVVLDLAAVDGGMAPGGEPVFLSDGATTAVASGVGGAPVDADLVRAWASSISPLMGASLTEPLITAAMTARVTPTESAVAAHAAATDLTPLASAFAGQRVRSSVPLTTSELEHE